MPTIFTHGVAAMALIAAFPKAALPRRLMLPGALCAMTPDADVLGFLFGVRYGDFWGHRGFSHSLVFAAGLAWIVTLLVKRWRRSFVMTWIYLFLATASHALLDALTNGGLGVALLSPMDDARLFFRFRPIAVSPIGPSFFSERGLAVLWSEFRWVWLPSLAFALIALAVRDTASRARARCLGPGGTA